MSNILVINLTGITQHVGVIHASGQKDDVQIVPRRRVELRDGMTVDPAWIGRNPGCIKVVVPPSVSPVVVAPRRQPTPTAALTVEDLQPNGTPSDQKTVADVEAQPTEGEEA